MHQSLPYSPSSVLRTLVVLLLLAAAQTAAAQSDHAGGVTVHGSVQSDVLTLAREDDRIGTGKPDDRFMTNTYAELRLQHRYVQAGARLEYNDHPLPGFESDFRGWGVPHFFVRGTYKWADLTLGDFYEQFGAGLILRTYEERSLGIDNALRGARLALQPAKGVSLKLLAGQQRYYWHHRNLDACSPWTFGADAELSLDAWNRRLQQSGTHLTLGFSALGNHFGRETDIYTTVEPSADGTDVVAARLRMPQTVPAFDARISLGRGAWSFLAEYAWKGQDPSAVNGYTYKHGQALLLSASYSRRGLSLMAQAKRSEDMTFRSRRTASRQTTAVRLNHLPAFTLPHTYALAALYPYASQSTPGEWAFQGEAAYTFKRRTPLGGRYGTLLRLDFSHIRAIDGQTDERHANTPGGNGTRSRFFRMGRELYFQDLSMQMEKRLSKRFKMSALYSWQRYNKTVVEGEGGMVGSHVFVLDGRWRLSKRLALRAEAQYLHTRQDQGDWWIGLAELSLTPHWVVTLSDMYNADVPYYTRAGAVDESRGTHRQHYMMGSVAFTHKAHRLQAGYGKTRAGYNCSGGVCRFVPAQSGLQLSYSFNF